MEAAKKPTPSVIIPMSSMAGYLSNRLRKLSTRWPLSSATLADIPGMNTSYSRPEESGFVGGSNACSRVKFREALLLSGISKL
jgi:hypothetical protein